MPWVLINWKNPMSAIPLEDEHGLNSAESLIREKLNNLDDFDFHILAVVNGEPKFLIDRLTDKGLAANQETGNKNTWLCPRCSHNKVCLIAKFMRKHTGVEIRDCIHFTKEGDA